MQCRNPGVTPFLLNTHSIYMNPIYTLIPENKFFLETNCVAKNYLWHRSKYIHRYMHTCKS